jgi:hypothetical protein
MPDATDADKSAASPDPVLAPSATDQLIDHWFIESFYDSLVARDTQIFNQVQAAKDELKRRLSKESR